jgi:hypothetical protein
LKKSPEVQAALVILAANLRYVVQSRNPRLSGIASVWHTRTEFGTIIGKKRAYDAMSVASKEEADDVEWRVLPQSEADRYSQGLENGIRLAKMFPAVDLTHHH